MGADICLTSNNSHKISVLDLVKVFSVSKLCSVLFVSICVLLSCTVYAGPVIFNAAYMQGPVSVARNIRHLPCISRRTGEEGVCMFAIDCLKSNGSHLGTCIDRFYFGSCCQIANHNVVPQIVNNNLDENLVFGDITTKRSHLTTTQKNIDLLESKTESTHADKVPQITSTAASIDKKATVVIDRRNTTQKTVSSTEQPLKFSTFQSVVDVSSKATTEKIPATTKATTNTTKLSSNKPNKYNSTYNRPKPPIVLKPQNITKKPARPTFKPSYKPRPSYRPVITTRTTTTTTTSTTKALTSTTTTTSKPTTTIDPYEVLLNVSKRPIPPYKPPPKRTTTTRKPSTYPKVNITSFPSTKRPVRPESSITYINYSTPEESPKPVTTETPIKLSPTPNKTIEDKLTYNSTLNEIDTSTPGLVTWSYTVDETTKAPASSLVTNEPSVSTTPSIITFSTYSSDASSSSTTNTSSVFSEYPPTDPTTLLTFTIISTPTKQSSNTPTDKISETTSGHKTTTQISSSEKPTVIYTNAPLTTVNEFFTLEDVLQTNLPSSASSTTVKIAETTFSDSTILSTTARPLETKPVTSEPKPIITESVPVSSTTIQISSTEYSEDKIETATFASITTLKEESPEIMTVASPSTVLVTDQDWSPITPPDGWVLVSTFKPTSGVPVTSEKVITETSTASTNTSTTSKTTTTIEANMKVTTPVTVSSKPTLKPITTVESFSSNSSRMPVTTTASTVPIPVTTTTTEPIPVTTTASTVPIPVTTNASTSPIPVTTTASTIPEFTVNVTLRPTVTTSTESLVTVPLDNVSVTLVPGLYLSTQGLLNQTENNLMNTSTLDNGSTLKPLDQRPANVTTLKPLNQQQANVTVTSPNATSLPTTATETPPNMTDYKQVCGRRLWPEARIVGGSKSAFGRWPWQISLRQWRTSTYLHKCGAALLNENWAITAAHCVDNVPPSELLVRLGEHDLANEAEPYGFQERRIQIVASHPHFEPATFEYDLALLRFYEPVTFQPNILPVCVPEDDDDFVGQTAYVTGWGRLYDEGPLPSVLQEVSVPIINNSVCEGMYRVAGFNEHIPNIFICAGFKEGRADSCEGDSGGPMVLQRRKDGRFVLGGVISWGIGCAEPNQPGVYTRISEFREWINQILQF